MTISQECYTLGITDEGKTMLMKVFNKGQVVIPSRIRKILGAVDFKKTKATKVINPCRVLLKL